MKHLEYYLPEIVISEVKKYLPYIIQKSGLTEEEIKKFLNTLRSLFCQKNERVVEIKYDKFICENEKGNA